MNGSQQILFIQRLALYLRSGIPIARAIALIAEDSQTKSVLHVLTTLEETIATGLPLSHSLTKFPKQFDSLAIGFVRAGEASGTLAETLERLAFALGKREALRRKILGALAYPIIVLCGTISVALFLTLFIFPKIVPVLQGFKSTLPFPTRVLIGINNLFVHQWILLLCGSVLIIAGFIFSIRFQRVRQILERALLRIPIFSSLYQYYAVATFSRVLSLQLRGGVRIISALTLVRDSVPGTLYPEAIALIEVQIAEGQRFSSALREHPRLFPSTICQLVAAGEATGTLTANLETLAALYEESLDELSKNLSVLIEPVMMIVMGLVVGFVALAIITPIYGVTQNLNIK